MSSHHLQPDTTLMSADARNSIDKSANSSKKRYCGVWSPCLTPVTRGLSIDIPKMAEHIKWLMENGCHGIVLFGTTGEAPSFSAHERMQALENLIGEGIDPHRLIIGNGFASLTDSVHVTRHAMQAGCETVLMMPPFYFKDPSPHGVAASFRLVFDQVSSSRLRVLLYHYPRMSGVPITHNLIRSLLQSHSDLIAGLKDSTGEWSSIKSYIKEFPELAIFSGSDAQLLPTLRASGNGTISATANINPAGIRQIFDLWRDGPDASAAQAKASEIRDIIAQFPLANALKAVWADYRKDPNWNLTRPPLTALTKTQCAELADSLKEAGHVFPGS